MDHLHAVTEASATVSAGTTTRARVRQDGSAPTVSLTQVSDVGVSSCVDRFDVCIFFNDQKCTENRAMLLNKRQVMLLKRGSEFYVCFVSRRTWQNSRNEGNGEVTRKEI